MRVFVLNEENKDARPGSVYRFYSMGKTISWPMQDGALLGPVGSWNFLFRLGMHPEYVTQIGLSKPSKGDLLFVIAEDETLSATVRESIDRWLTDGGIVIAGGSLEAWKWLLPNGSIVEQARCEYPQAALAWELGDNPPELIAPPLWTYSRLITNGSVLAFGKLLAIHGERQTPQRALATPLKDAPAIICHKNFIFLNGNPFAAFQAWLQGQEDLGPWLQWRHRLFWLDEQVAFLLKALNQYALPPQQIMPRSIPGLPETVVVLRHDLDHSRDTSYIEAEKLAGVPGVHAVLRDKNTGFWTRVLQRMPEHEPAFHYSTAAYNRWIEGARSILGLSKRLYLPVWRKIIGDGLVKQVRWAKHNGIGVSTLHRHQCYLIYPEWIDAMHNVFCEIPEALGGSSLFRGQILRWKSDRADGDRGTYGEFPDAQFPYWFPCKLAHAGLGGRLLRGWETASVMEIEPELFKQMLDHRVPGILHRVITINYHPAHAQHPDFCSQGSLPWWRDILKIVKERNIEIKTLRDVYAAMNEAVMKKRAG